MIILAPVFSPLVYFWFVVRHEIFRDETGDSACHLIVAGGGGLYLSVGNSCVVCVFEATRQQAYSSPEVVNV